MRATLAAALAAACASSAALAQSQVTVFGIADAALRSVSNTGVGTGRTVVSGSNSTSRLGFRGVEDLGGGLSAGFHLEHGVLLDTGTPASSSKYFDRRSTVSLMGRSWGEIRIGRDFTPTYTNWSRYDPFAYVGVARTADLFSNAPNGPIRAAFGTNDNTTVRSDNSVQWILPRLGGLEGSLMVAAREGGTAAQGAANVLGGVLGYRGQGWGLAVATTSTQNTLTTDGRFRDSSVGGSYRAGPVTVTAAVRRMSYSTARQTNLLVGATADFGPHQVKLSVHRVDMAGRVGATSIDTGDALQLGLGYVYSLSKRSVLYATAAQIDNRAGGRYTAPGGPSGMAAGGTSRGVELGVRHSF